MKMIQPISISVCLLSVLLSSISSYAELTNNLDGTITQTRIDGSVLMWLQDANTIYTSGYDADGRMTWNEANTWIGTLNNSNYLGYNDWRLPSTLNTNGSGPCIGYNCIYSEMGYLYYIELGNIGRYNTSGSPTDCFESFNCLTNTSPFINVQVGFYWSNMAYAPSPGVIWGFDFDSGEQSIEHWSYGNSAWAVRSAGVVPEPISPYDTNQDWVIGDFELLNAIDNWASGLLGNFELLDLIDFWAAGCYHWDSSTNESKSGCSGNNAPLAHSGSDQNVTPGSVITLDGSGSGDSDGNILTYIWSFISKPGGSNATLSDSTVVNPTFTADVYGMYVIRLIVNDGTVDGLADSVTITARNTHNITDFSLLPLNANINDFKVSRTSPGKLFCVTSDDPFKLFISNDYGETWQEIQNPIFSGKYPSISVSDIDDGIVFIASRESIYKSIDNGNNWTYVPQLSSLKDWRKVSINGNTVVASRQDIIPQSTLFKSIDLGNTWTDISPSNASFPFGMIIDNLDANNIYAHGSYKYDQIGNTGYWRFYIYVSNNGGQSFDQINQCGNQPGDECGSQFLSFFVDKDNGNVFAASTSGLYLSKDKGMSWTDISLPTRAYARDVVVVKNIVFRSGFDLMVAYDTVNTWETINVYNGGNLVASRSLDFSDNYIYFSSSYGLYRAEIY